MSIDTDKPLPPLTPKVPPAAPVKALLAVDSVTLAAGAIPRGILKDFYTRLLGMTFVPTEDSSVSFTFQRRQVRLVRDQTGPGRLGMLLYQFDEALLRLRDRQIAYELLHTDGGLTRMALLRDPAGNWLHLLETRPF